MARISTATKAYMVADRIVKVMLAEDLLAVPSYSKNGVSYRPLSIQELNDLQKVIEQQVKDLI